MIKLGDVVYLYSDRNKLTEREKYLVVKVDGYYTIVQKFAGQQLRSKRYKVKSSDIITSYPTILPVESDLQFSDDEMLNISVETEVQDDNTVEEIPNREEPNREVIQEDELENEVEDEVDNDESFHPVINIPIEDTAAARRPSRQNAGKPPERYRE